MKVSRSVVKLEIDGTHPRRVYGARISRVITTDGAVEEKSPCSFCKTISFKMIPPRNGVFIDLGAVSNCYYFVGEAPGTQEVLKLMPFVGPAGNILQTALKDAEYEFDKLRFWNAVCCPPYNEETGKLRTPTVNEAVNCSAYVKTDIVASKARGIVLLGRIALQSFFSSNEKISKLSMEDASVESVRGSWKWNGIPVMVAYHPSYILRIGGTGTDTYYKWARNFRLFREKCDTNVAEE